MEWDRKRVVRSAFRYTFNKGIKAWLLLVAVGMIFAFTGSANSSQGFLVDRADSALGFENPYVVDNSDILEDYLADILTLQGEQVDAEIIDAVVNYISRGATGVVLLLGANRAYMERNPGEVIWLLLAGGTLVLLVKFFIQNVFLIGRNRYTLENHFEKEVRISRIFSPFHRKNLPNLVWTNFCFHVTLVLWSFTIVGYFYKYYQYAMVPYILAENPAIPWKDAKRISSAMTKGYKWKIFKAQLSVFYMWFIKSIPIAGVLTGIPFEMQFFSEIYLELRKHLENPESLLIEEAFGNKGYLEHSVDCEATYYLKDIVKQQTVDVGEHYYQLTDYIAIFFVFCFIGYFWEVGLHLVTNHELANRGIMYGPWLPIYGVGGTLIILLLSKYKENRFRLFGTTLLLCGILEYLTSFILDFVYNSSYWNYDDMFLNINGRICLSGLLAFGIGGQFGIYVAGPKIRETMRLLSRKKQIVICAILVTAFALDILCCMIIGFNTGAGVGGTY